MLRTLIDLEVQDLDERETEALATILCAANRGEADLRSIADGIVSDVGQSILERATDRYPEVAA